MLGAGGGAWSGGELEGWGGGLRREGGWGDVVGWVYGGVIPSNEVLEGEGDGSGG